MIAHRYNDSIHTNCFTCIWWFHVIQSYCEWHRLVDSNVWMTRPFCGGFSRSIFSLKNFFSSILLMSLFHLVSVCVRISAVYFSKLRINIQNSILLHLLARIHFHLSIKKEREWLNRNPISVIWFWHFHHYNLNHGVFWSILYSLPEVTPSSNKWRREQQKKYNTRKFCNSLFCIVCACACALCISFSLRAPQKRQKFSSNHKRPHTHQKGKKKYKHEHKLHYVLFIQKFGGLFTRQICGI